MTKKSKPIRKACSREQCPKDEQAISNFYTTSDIDIFPDKKIPVCKTCCAEIFEVQGFDGFKSIMRLINKPIYEELFKGDYGEYIKNINSLRQYSATTYDDSTLFQASRSMESMKRVKPKEMSEDDLREAEDYFGRGYEEADYIFLKYEMDSWKNEYGVETKALEELISEICLTKLDIRKRRSESKDVDKQLKTLQDLLGSSNLKPMQETGNQAGDIHESFGLLIKRFENDRPIPEPDPMWEDVDSIGKYIRTFFTGHMARMLGKENEFQDEYDEVIDEYTVRPRDYDESQDGDDK